jgi:site-specific DNA-methyltransferase (cytosine-N4-specific)
MCSTRFSAGTAGLVAQQTGRKYVGIELHPEYVTLAAQRLEADERTIIKIVA